MNKLDIMKAAELAKSWLNADIVLTDDLKVQIASSLVAAAELLKQVELDKAVSVLESVIDYYSDEDGVVRAGPNFAYEAQETLTEIKESR